MNVQHTQNSELIINAELYNLIKDEMWWNKKKLK